MGPDKQNSVMNTRRDDHRPKVAKAYGKLGTLYDLVYIKPDLQKAGKSASGILLPTPKHQGPPTTGKVLAIGPDVKTVKVGEHVVFNDKNAKGFWLNDVAHIPLKEEQIVAKIVGKKS